MPRTNRSSGRVGSIQLVEWDFSAFLLLDEHRFLTPHDLSLLTGRSYDTTRRRCKILLDGGYLGESKQKIGKELNEARLLALANAGAKEVAALKSLRPSAVEWGDKNRYYKRTSLEHLKLTNDFLIAVKCGIRDMGGRYIPREEIFLGSPALDKKNPNKLSAWVPSDKQGQERELKERVPDAFFGIELPDNTKRFYFLESDRSTMRLTPSPMRDQSNILDKMNTYYHWWAEKKHNSVYGIKRFRTIFLAGESLERANNMKATNHLIRDDGWNAFLFGYIDDLLEYENILNAPFLNGNGKTTSLVE